MTDQQITILAVGATMLLIAIAVLIYRWVRKTYYAYNEYTGRVGLKSKIHQMDKELEDKHKEYKEKQRAEQLKKQKFSVQKKDPKRFLPNEAAGDEMVLANVKKIGKSKGRFAIQFRDAITAEEFALFVDEETFNTAKVGQLGTLCYNAVNSIFYYFEPMPGIVDILKEDALREYEKENK